MRITLLRAWPDRSEDRIMELPDGATLHDALLRSGWDVAADAPTGVWGKAQARERVLREGDRVEVYRPLVADPKAARRKRASHQSE